jgi:hypothetical protein
VAQTIALQVRIFMAYQRDDRHDERERSRFNMSRSQDWGYRGEYESGRPSQWDQSEHFAGERQRPDDFEWQRGREEHWAPRRETNFREPSGPRHSSQGAADYGHPRERPYSGPNPYAGHSGHSDSFREDSDRSYGATGSGADWGTTGMARHRVGSLTESAAASAQNVINSREEFRENRYRESHAGKGPKGYQRSDERIREEVCELLTRSRDVDASDIDVTVSGGLVSLAGTVPDRRSKRIAEDLAQDAWGVRDVNNQLRAHEVHTQASKTVSTGETPKSATGSVLGLGAKN